MKNTLHGRLNSLGLDISQLVLVSNDSFQLILKFSLFCGHLKLLIKFNHVSGFVYLHFMSHLSFYRSFERSSLIFRISFRPFSLQDRLPGDDNLPDQLAEIFHDLSHAFHAMSDLSFNFSAPPPQRLMCFPSLSPMMFPMPFQGGFLPQTSGPMGASTSFGRTSTSGSTSQVFM